MVFLSRGFKNLQWYSMTEQIRTSDLDALIFLLDEKNSIPTPMREVHFNQR